jgi:hypothetical protein
MGKGIPASASFIKKLEILDGVTSNVEVPSPNNAIFVLSGERSKN